MNIPPRNVDIAIIGLSCRFPGAAQLKNFGRIFATALNQSLFFRSRTCVSRHRTVVGSQLQLCKGGTNVARRRNVRCVVLRLLPQPRSPYGSTATPVPGGVLGGVSKVQVMIRLVTQERSAFFRPAEASFQAICWQSCTMPIFPARQQVLRTLITTKTS